MSLEKKVGNIVRGIAITSSLYGAGCGTTLHLQRGGVWYGCNTNEDYPPGHPCNGEIEAYNARMAAASPAVASSPDYFSRMSEQERRDFYGVKQNKNGHWECPKK